MAKPDEKDDAEMQRELDELAARRERAREGKLEGEGTGDGDRSLEELEAEREKAAAEAAAQEEADGQFALEIPEPSRKINLGTLIPRGTAVEVKYKMSGRSIANVKGGIMDPTDTSGLLIASRVVEGVHIRFTRDADLKIEKATIFVEIGTRHVVSAHTEAGDLLLRGEAEAA